MIQPQKTKSIQVILTGFSICIALFFPTTSYAQKELFGTGTSVQEEQSGIPSLERSINNLKNLISLGYTKEQTAHYVYDTVKRLLTTCNQDGNHMLPECYAMQARKELGYLGPEYKQAALYAWEEQVGNCNEHASLVYYILKRTGAGDDLRLLTDNFETGEYDSHVFVAWGLKGERDPNDMSDWRSDAILIDTWEGRFRVGDAITLDNLVSDDTANRGGRRTRFQNGYKAEPANPIAIDKNESNRNIMNCGRKTTGINRDIFGQPYRGMGCWCQDWTNPIERNGQLLPERVWISLANTLEGKKCL
ncbi:MAG: hypothetical protein GY694_21235 [Gammaproteobacteria bacterium]|nr:hypothetical protein [Gammaproteobacteria bacterium]